MTDVILATKEEMAAKDALIRELVKALSDAIEGYSDGSQYKGDYLRDKHGDVEDIARLRSVLAKAKAAGYEP